MGDLFTAEENCGFHLDFFELYNWGIFNENVYKVQCGGKSTLLTGENGSGKTTLVDAITTLLVPSQLRFYNQSSGSTHKKDRSEESYVLGAYGNLQSENSFSGKTQYLRTKENAISILNGCFYDSSLNSYVTLLQVRYFSSIGELQRIFALSRTKLSIYEITKTLEENGTSIDKGGKWKKILESKYKTFFFGDNFKKYSDTFSSIFGFRSEKALRLFSQIIGLKVLGNLTDFIRTNMIEEIDVKSEFEKLQENYTKLIQCDKEIQKTKKQMELLEPVLKNGENWKHKKLEKENCDNLKQTVPFWRAKNAKNLLESEKSELEKLLETTRGNISVKKSQIERFESEISAINNSLATNDTKRRIDAIEVQLKNLNEEKNRIQKSRDDFEEWLHNAGLEVPTTQNQFEKLFPQIQNLLEKNKTKKDELSEKEFTERTFLENLKGEIAQIENELRSLGSRTSNIPFENIKIREEICSALKIEESEIPFAGELIQVKKSEQKWNYAIERLLHNFALDILVPENLYKKVTEYVKSNRIGGEKGGRLVYLKTSESDFELEIENRYAEQRNLILNSASTKTLKQVQGDNVQVQDDKNQTVPSKIEIKQNHPLYNWLLSYASQHFSYVCTDDTEIISKSEKALTSTGLIKNGEKHEKDDRRKMRENFVQVLGWDNTEKRKMLSSQFDKLNENLSETKGKLLKIQTTEENIQNSLNNLNRLLEISTWDSVDVERRVKEIDSLNEEKQKLESSKDLKDLMESKKSKESEKQTFEEERDILIKKIGSLENQLEEITKNISENENALLIFTNDKEKLAVLEKTILLLSEEYPRLTNAKTFSEVEKNSGTMTNELETKSNSLQRTVQGYERAISNSMNALKYPSKEIIHQFSDWSEEFSSLGSSFEYLSDYEAFYNRLKKDDLPKYQNDFHNYLHVTMKNDMIDFKQFIENGKTEIEHAISNLNQSLQKITYNKNPNTYLQLVLQKTNDTRIRDFQQKLAAAIPDVVRISQNDAEYEEQIFRQIKLFLDLFKENEIAKKFVLDIRNWFTFAANELFMEDAKQKQFYNDSASLSGGEKAKLTYTILASAIAYQFGLGVNETESSEKSFRFVIIDEAFSKSDATNSEYAMKLFKQLNLQLMVVTPLDKINIVEDYISSVHMTENKGTDDSRLISMTIERYKEEQKIAEEVENE